MLPISLEIKNFFSHRDSFVDFTQFDSALLIGNIEGNYDQSNGSGKSVLLESILWCLFNKSRAASMDDVIFWNETSCRVIFTFKHAGEIYRISRKRNRTASNTFVDFYRQDNGSWVDISGSTASLTNAEIEKTIKLDFKTFINSAYFRQNDVLEFAESDPAKKKDILKTIINLSKWDHYEDRIKDKLKALKLESKILSAKTEDYQQLILEYDLAEENLKIAEEQLAEFSRERKNVDENLQKTTQRYLEIKETLDTQAWDKSTEVIEKKKKEIGFLEDKINSENKSILDYQSKIKTKKETIKSLGEKLQELSFDNEIEKKIKELNQELVEHKSKLGFSMEMLDNLKERRVAKEQCYVCHQPIEENLYQKLLDQQVEETDKYQKIQIYSQNKISELGSKSKAYEKIRDNNKLRESFSVKAKALKTEIETLTERLNELQQEKQVAEEKLSNARGEVELNLKILESIRNDDFKILHQEIVRLREAVKQASNWVEKTNHQVGVLTEKKASIKHKINDIEGFQKEYLEVQKKVISLEKAAKMLGKNGIQVILLNAIIEDLEKTSNQILSSICNEPFTVFLDTQRIGSDGVSIVETLDLRVKKDGVVQNFKSLSGGEQFRVSLALRIALSEISSRHGGSALEFLLLDEINSPLDRHGTDSLFINIIKSLEKKYKILMITHNDSLKEKFSNIIDITKINGESTVNFISI